MKTLEPKLPSKYRLTVATTPTELAEQPQASPAIRKVVPSSAPWETMLYWNAIQKLSQNSQRLAPELFKRLQMFAGKHPLAAGRILHLLGETEAQDGGQAAKSHYLQAELPDQAIRTLATDAALQAEMGLRRSPRDDEATWSKRIAISQELPPASEGPSQLLAWTDALRSGRTCDGDELAEGTDPGGCTTGILGRRRPLQSGKGV